ncbi:MAG TPA: hypothetical protein VHH36_02610, partial [Candidatus Thermoplasmatota archaeon]|nr:hypothetical protein [Candidatus Thermoplasmatota archaeon]
MRPALALLLLALPLAGCSSEEPPADPALVATEVGGGIVNATAAPAEPRRLEVLWDGEVPLSAGPCWPYTPPECLDATGIDDERRLWPFAGRAAGGAVTVTWTPNSTLSTELRAV